MRFRRPWIFVALAHCLVIGILIWKQDSFIPPRVQKKVTVHLHASSEAIASLNEANALLDEAIALIALPPPECEENTIEPEVPAEILPVSSPPPQKKGEKIVQKEKPAPKKEIAAKKPPTPTKPTPPVKSTPPTPSKKKETPQVVVKKEAPSEKISSDQKKQLVSLMKQGLATLNKTDNVLKKAPSSSSLNADLNAVSSFLAESFSIYQDELIAYLKHRLELPENGNVSLQLTLTAQGKVARIKILSSTSEKNRSYVEKELPPLAFPPFGDRLKGEKEHTFPVTLTTRA